MELYIIRHAQSANNALQSPSERVEDPHITDLGLQQAELLASYVKEHAGPRMGDSRWSDLGITRIISSAMCRALQTSQYLSRSLGLPVEIWVEIHEWGGIYLDHSEAGGVVGYPGKTRSDILREFPDCILPDGITEQGWWNGTREEKSACQGRAIEVATRLWNLAESDQRIAMISHGDFIDSLLKALFNQLPGDGLYYRHSNTGITRLDLTGDGHLTNRYMNRIEHLPPELIS